MKELFQSFRDHSGELSYFVWKSLWIIFLFSAQIGLMLMMNVMKVLLYTFSAICKNFQKFLTRTVETLKKIIAYLIKSFMKPMQLIFIAILNSFFTLKFTQNGQNLLTEAIVALNEHSAKHIVRSSIQGKEVLFIFTVKLSINILSAIGIETLKS